MGVIGESHTKNAAAAVMFPWRQRQLGQPLSTTAIAGHR
jgi:hypothetical protein